MNKTVLIRKIIATLSRELETYGRAARAAHAEATHEQSRAENKYDTRGLEASYLARGQSRQAAALEETLRQYESMTVRRFGPGEPADLGAVVILDGNGDRSVYFLGPGAGGTEIQCGSDEVTVITPQSPLGRQLLGRKAGETISIDLAGASRSFRVETVA